jgi:hypothetical protein
VATPSNAKVKKTAGVSRYRFTKKICLRLPAGLMIVFARIVLLNSLRNEFEIIMNYDTDESYLIYAILDVSKQ